jgi:hypothetical protein
VKKNNQPHFDHLKWRFIRLLRCSNAVHDPVDFLVIVRHPLTAGGNLVSSIGGDEGVENAWVLPGAGFIA